MSYVPDYGTSSYTGDMNMAGSTGNLEPLNLGPNIFLAQPGDLLPEAMQSRVPTVRQLPDKIEKKLFLLNIKPKIFLLKLSKLKVSQFSHQVLLLQVYQISKRQNEWIR